MREKVNVFNCVPDVLSDFGTQRAIEMQTTLNSLVSKLSPALLEYEQTMSKIQQNLSSVLLQVNPMLEWCSVNQALLKSMDMISTQMQSVLPVIDNNVARSLSSCMSSFTHAINEMRIVETWSAQYKAITHLSELMAVQEIHNVFETWRDTRVDLLSMLNEVSDISEQNEELNLEDGFSCNEEIYEAIEEQVSNPAGFQERVANWTEKKIKQFFILYMFICFIWQNFIQPYFQENIGKPVMAWTVAHVKELPEAAGNLITDLKEDIEAIIIENCPYYYKVSFVDENGNEKEGYVSKRSVRVIETVDEPEETEEDTQ